MKKLFIILGVIIMSFATSCELIDDMTCADNRDPISVTIVPHVIIFDADGNRVRNYPFNYRIYKEYCDGRTNGEFIGDYFTDDAGTKVIPYQSTYNMKNSEDRVVIHFLGGYSALYDEWQLDELHSLYYADLVEYDKKTLQLNCYLTLKEW